MKIILSFLAHGTSPDLNKTVLNEFQQLWGGSVRHIFPLAPFSPYVSSAPKKHWMLHFTSCILMMSSFCKAKNTGIFATLSNHQPHKTQPTIFDMIQSCAGRPQWISSTFHSSYNRAWYHKGNGGSTDSVFPHCNAFLLQELSCNVDWSVPIFTNHQTHDKHFSDFRKLYVKATENITQLLVKSNHMMGVKNGAVPH